MREIAVLTKRNILVYLRDKASVFFSFLSVIILLGVYLLFLKDLYKIDNIDAVSQKIFMIAHVMGGVLVIATITLSLGVIGNYVNDLDTKKINGYLVTPIKRYKLTLSYYLSTAILTIVLTLILFFIAFVFLGVASGYWYSFFSILKIVGMLILFSLISSSIMVFIASFIKSINALGGVSAVVGTLIGFVSGAYMPLTMLDVFTQTLAGILPFSHMTYYLRKVLLEPIIHLIPEQVLYSVGVVEVKVFGIIMPAYVIAIFSIALAIGLFVLSYFRINKKQTK